MIYIKEVAGFNPDSLCGEQSKRKTIQFDQKSLKKI